MTPEQIQNWRDFLRLSIGALADSMPINIIMKIRDNYQAQADALAEEMKPKPVIDKDGRCQHNVNAKYCKVCRK